MNKKFISTKMKIFLLAMFILSIVFYACGCIVLLQSNYNLSNYSAELNFNPNFLRYNFNFSNNFLNFTNSYSSADYDITDDISEIDFNMNSQSLEIVNTDTDKINIKIKGFSSYDAQLNLLNSTNKMTFSTTIDIPDNAEVLISIPENYSRKLTFKITTSSGDINLNNISANSVNTSSANGNINLNNCNLNYLSSSTSSGNIDLNSLNSSINTNLSSLSGSIDGNGNFGVLTGTTSSGDMNLTFKNNLNNTFISAVSGSVNLSIPSNCGYGVNYSTISGQLNSSEDTLTNGDESSKINVNTNSGDLSIQLK